MMQALRRVIHLLTLLVLASPASLVGATVQWQLDAGGAIVGKPTIHDGTIYIAGGETVVATTLEGEVRWRREVGAPVAAAVRVHDGVVFVHSSAGLHAFDDRGESLWTFEAEDQGPLVDGRSWGWGNEILPDPWGWYRSAPTIVGEVVVFGTSAGIHAVSRATGEAVWQVPVGPVTADAAMTEELVIVASWNNSVYGLERDTGKVRWRFRAPVPPSKGVDWIGYEGFHLTPVVEGDRVFVGNRGTYFFALDADDGTVAWSSKVGASWMGSPAAVSEDGVFYGLSDGMAVLGHRKASGALSLFFRTDSIVFAQPELSGTDLVVGSLSGHLFVVDSLTGQGERVLALGSEEPRYAEFFDPKIVPDGLSPWEATGWSVDRMLRQSNSILNLTVAGGTAFVGTASGVLYAIDLE